MMSVTVSIPLRQAGGRGTLELRLELGEDGASVSAVQQRSTAAALLGFMDEKARSDQELSEESSQHLRYRQDEASGLAGEEERESVRAAEMMGRRMRDVGDEFMAQMYRDSRTSSFIDDIVRVEANNASAVRTAFTHFCEVVNIILQCDESGAAQMITVGRVAALFSYCYHLCKVFVFKRGIMVSL
ncbi:hypothetical protein GBAR_LOCUS5753 [Geodia barretti]|uniref:Uncharacterized protein n=1 Tax=Geodia barretti TaxID=519541 RepID=A0AA35W8X6_GEOBA|nr:hypothetical protein GBAR_LOCUS5753 [Geodia barretti]